MAAQVFILVAEDEHLIALSVQECLEQGGYTAFVASSGDEALSVVNGGEHQISALITDIRLGGGPDGWDLARHARELNPSLPVVYMSGDSSHEHGSRGVPDSLMVQKPFAAAQIVTAISTLLNAAAVRPPE